MARHWNNNTNYHCISRLNNVQTAVVIIPAESGLPDGRVPGQAGHQVRPVQGRRPLQVQGGLQGQPDPEHLRLISCDRWDRKNLSPSGQTFHPITITCSILKPSFSVPPNKPLMVTDPANVESYQQGRSLRISCIVKSGQSGHSNTLDPVTHPSPAGKPSPNITWTINDSQTAVSSLLGRECPGSGGGQVLGTTMSVTPPSLLVSTLTSSCIPRSLAGAKLGCSASNNNISQPARSHLYLKVLGEPFQHFSQNQSIATIEFRLEITSVPSYKVEI